MEFRDKEGKWFSYMKGVPVKTVADLDSEEFSFQGIDILDSRSEATPIPGCINPTAINYDPTATIDDGSCVVCSLINIEYAVRSELMAHGGMGIQVNLLDSGDDLPYNVSCENSSGTLIGDTGGTNPFGHTTTPSTTPPGTSVFFGTSTVLPSDTYTITITTANGCTTQQTIIIDNGAVSSTGGTGTVAIPI